MDQYTLVVTIGGEHFTATVQAPDDAGAVKRATDLAQLIGEPISVFRNNADPFGPS